MEIIISIILIVVLIYVIKNKKNKANYEKPNVEHKITSAYKPTELVEAKNNNEGIISGQQKNIKNKPMPVGWINKNTTKNEESMGDVLIVDDSQTVLMYLKNIVQTMKFNGLTKVNGKEGLDYLLSSGLNIPRLIITDLEMPIMDGDEFIKNIRKIERLKNIPIIIVSSNPENSFYLLENGLVNGILKKPFDNQNLISQIEYLTEIN